MEIIDSPESARLLLIGQEVSAVCFVRDYVELHFGGPVLRALSDPVGVYGGHEWRFPAPGSLELMHGYIGKTVDGFELDPDRILALGFGEHRFAIPLDEASRVGPEAAHLIGAKDNGQIDLSQWWIW